MRRSSQIERRAWQTANVHARRRPTGPSSDQRQPTSTQVANLALCEGRHPVEALTRTERASTRGELDFAVPQRATGQWTSQWPVLRH